MRIKVQKITARREKIMVLHLPNKCGPNMSRKVNIVEPELLRNKRIKRP